AERPAGLEDLQKPRRRGGDGVHLEVHDHRLAEHVGEALRGDAVEPWQCRLGERDRGVSLTCLRQQTQGWVIADGREAALAHPSRFTATATPDIRRWPGPEELLDQLVEVARGGLLLPFICI